MPSSKAEGFAASALNKHLAVVNFTPQKYPNTALDITQAHAFCLQQLLLYGLRLLHSYLWNLNGYFCLRLCWATSREDWQFIQGAGETVSLHCSFP